MSAPRLSVPGSSVPNTGGVYTCPVNVGVCSGLIGNGDPNDDDGRLFDTRRTYLPYIYYKYPVGIVTGLIVRI